MPFPVKNTSLYYLIESGEVLRQAQAYRTTFIRLAEALYAVAESLGGTGVRYCPRMMLLEGVRFPQGKTPEGWMKPDDLGVSRPKRLKVNAEILKHFTPSGCYTVTRHVELEPFFTWLGCPVGYRYTQGENCRGSTAIGAIFEPVGVEWYAENGPLLLWLPPVAAEKAAAAKEGKIVENNVLDWTPPAGLRQILREEWDLMKAQYEAQEKDTDVS